MPLTPFQDFLVACVGTSASFIGLLFVALSLVITRQGENQELEFSDRRLAESSFTALVDVFFVSLIALLPGNNIGWTSLVMGLIGLRSSWRLFTRAKIIQREEGKYPKREVFWVFSSIILYLVQGFYGWQLILHPGSAGDLNATMSILIVLFGGALTRSWELTGIKQGRKK